MGWHLDWERLSRPGNIDIQFKIFSDYGSHIAFPGHPGLPPRAPAARAFCFGAGTTPPLISTRSWHTNNRILDALEIHVFESGHAAGNP
ncbi:hypothetical protein RGR602_PC02007 (plasmid) [Rhizobium gallicum bv. gallicum R602sp]|uniref:Uncharacterized protein n=1 Tax=Rhizobium gallicum bv. gallicum R602sp TaxID=1041138 RepID=A0A0B4XH31_9HYPH|nr:hypothetical protein RGR602_PC02007 [Rhizobium gallicum bv. gallicum R602sp]